MWAAGGIPLGQRVGDVSHTPKCFAGVPTFSNARPLVSSLRCLGRDRVDSASVVLRITTRRNIFFWTLASEHCA